MKITWLGIFNTKLSDLPMINADHLLMDNRLRINGKYLTIKVTAVVSGILLKGINLGITKVAFQD